MAKADVIGFRADEDTRRKIERFRDDHGCEANSEALERMVHIAHRETRAPLLYRAQDVVANAAMHLAVLAILSVLAGASLPFMALMSGFQIALLLLATAGGLLAVHETAKLFTGQSALAEAVRRAVS